VDLFQFDLSVFKRFDLQIQFVMRFSKDSICGFDWQAKNQKRFDLYQLGWIRVQIPQA
jgi:hypothetical protein